jgi:hypothetical protein
MADHEADDVIASYATQHAGAVDVVTGDRDLFQLVDDARSVRVIYTGRGMSKLEVLDEAAVVEKYGVRASQYADFAVLRGDASDGLPGVAGIGEKTAAALLAARRPRRHHRRGSPRRPRGGRSGEDRRRDRLPRRRPAGRRGRPPLDLPAVGAPLRSPDPDATARLDAEWNLGAPLARAIAAITARA